MPYWRLYYHLVWATKNREPLVVPKIEEEVYEEIRRKVKALKGEVVAVNGMPDHTHLVTTIPPTFAVAEFIGQVKGVSSFHINHLKDCPYSLEWQRGYGAFSLSNRDVEAVIQYVERQKEHHASGKLWPSLERMDEEEDAPTGWMVREEREEYEIWSP